MLMWIYLFNLSLIHKNRSVVYLFYFSWEYHGFCLRPVKRNQPSLWPFVNFFCRSSFSWRVSTIMYGLVSSAKSRLFGFTSSTMSLMYIKKSRGPKTVLHWLMTTGKTVSVHVVYSQIETDELRKAVVIQNDNVYTQSKSNYNRQTKKHMYTLI